MRIDLNNKLATKVSCDQPDCYDLAKSLKAVKDDAELIEKLRTIKPWTYGKCEIGLFTDVLNHIDMILESACKICHSSDTQLWRLQLDCDTEEARVMRDWVTVILEFLCLLMEHSIYRYLWLPDRLIALLKSSSLDIVLSVLQVLYTLSKRSHYMNRIPEEAKKSVEQHLLCLAEKWGGKMNHLSLPECVSGNYNPSAHNVVISGLKQEKDSIVIPNVRETYSCDPCEVMERLLSMYRYEDDKLTFQLFCRVRLAVSFPDKQLRLKCIRIRLGALAILAYCYQLTEEVMDSGFLEEIFDLLQMDIDYDYEFQTSALNALTALMSSAKTIESVIRYVIYSFAVNRHQAIISSRVRHSVDLIMRCDPLSESQKAYITALFSCLYHLTCLDAQAPPSLRGLERVTDVLFSSSCVNCMLKLVAWTPRSRNEYFSYTTRAVRVIDQILVNIGHNAQRALTGAESHLSNNHILLQVEPTNWMVGLNRGHTLPAYTAAQLESTFRQNESASMMDTDSEPPVLAHFLPLYHQLPEANTPLQLQENIMALCISRLNEEVQSILQFLTENNVQSTCFTEIPYYECAHPLLSQQRLCLMKAILKTLKRMADDITYHQQFQSFFFTGNLLNFLKSLYERPEVFSWQMSLLAMECITQYIHKNPSELRKFQELDVTKSIFSVLSQSYIPVQREFVEVMCGIVCVLTLNETGSKQLLNNSKILSHLVTINSSDAHLAYWLRIGQSLRMDNILASQQPPSSVAMACAKGIKDLAANSNSAIAIQIEREVTRALNDLRVFAANIFSKEYSGPEEFKTFSDQSAMVELGCYNILRLLDNMMTLYALSNSLLQQFKDRSEICEALISLLQFPFLTPRIDRNPVLELLQKVYLKLAQDSTPMQKLTEYAADMMKRAFSNVPPDYQHDFSESKVLQNSIVNGRICPMKSTHFALVGLVHILDFWDSVFKNLMNFFDPFENFLAVWNFPKLFRFILHDLALIGNCSQQCSLIFEPLDEETLNFLPKPSNFLIPDSWVREFKDHSCIMALHKVLGMPLLRLWPAASTMGYTELYPICHLRDILCLLCMRVQNIFRSMTSFCDDMVQPNERFALILELTLEMVQVSDEMATSLVQTSRIASTTMVSSSQLKAQIFANYCVLKLFRMLIWLQPSDKNPTTLFSPLVLLLIHAGLLYVVNKLFISLAFLHRLDHSTDDRITTAAYNAFKKEWFLVVKDFTDFRAILDSQMKMKKTGSSLMQHWKLPSSYGLTLGVGHAIIYESISLLSLLCNKDDWTQFFSLDDTESLLTIFRHFCEAFKTASLESSEILNPHVQEMKSTYPVEGLEFLERYFVNLSNLKPKASSPEPSRNHSLYAAYSNAWDLSSNVNFETYLQDIPSNFPIFTEFPYGDDDDLLLDAPFKYKRSDETQSTSKKSDGSHKLEILESKLRDGWKNFLMEFKSTLPPETIIPKTVYDLILDCLPMCVSTSQSPKVIKFVADVISNPRQWPLIHMAIKNAWNCTIGGKGQLDSARNHIVLLVQLIFTYRFPLMLMLQYSRLEDYIWPLLKDVSLVTEDSMSLILSHIDFVTVTNMLLNQLHRSRRAFKGRQENIGPYYGCKEWQWFDERAGVWQLFNGSISRMLSDVYHNCVGTQPSATFVMQNNDYRMLYYNQCHINEKTFTIRQVLFGHANTMEMPQANKNFLQDTKEEGALERSMVKLTVQEPTLEQVSQQISLLCDLSNRIEYVYKESRLVDENSSMRLKHAQESTLRYIFSLLYAYPSLAKSCLLDSQWLKRLLDLRKVCNNRTTISHSLLNLLMRTVFETEEHLKYSMKIAIWCVCMHGDLQGGATMVPDAAGQRDVYYLTTILAPLLMRNRDIAEKLMLEEMHLEISDASVKNEKMSHSYFVSPVISNNVGTPPPLEQAQKDILHLLMDNVKSPFTLNNETPVISMEVFMRECCMSLCEYAVTSPAASQYLRDKENNYEFLSRLLYCSISSDTPSLHPHSTRLLVILLRTDNQECLEQVAIHVEQCLSFVVTYLAGKTSENHTENCRLQNEKNQIILSLCKLISRLSTSRWMLLRFYKKGILSTICRMLSLIDCRLSQARQLFTKILTLLVELTNSPLQQKVGSLYKSVTKPSVPTTSNTSTTLGDNAAKNVEMIAPLEESGNLFTDPMEPAPSNQAQMLDILPSSVTREVDELLTQMVDELNDSIMRDEDVDAGQHSVDLDNDDDDQNAMYSEEDDGGGVSDETDEAGVDDPSMPADALLNIIQQITNEREDNTNERQIAIADETATSTGHEGLSPEHDSNRRRYFVNIMFGPDDTPADANTRMNTTETEDAGTDSDIDNNENDYDDDYEEDEEREDMVLDVDDEDADEDEDEEEEENFFYEDGDEGLFSPDDGLEIAFYGNGINEANIVAPSADSGVIDYSDEPDWAFLSRTGGAGGRGWPAGGPRRMSSPIFPSRNGVIFGQWSQIHDIASQVQPFIGENMTVYRIRGPPPPNQRTQPAPSTTASGDNHSLYEHYFRSSVQPVTLSPTNEQHPSSHYLNLRPWRYVGRSMLPMVDVLGGDELVWQYHLNRIEDNTGSTTRSDWAPFSLRIWREMARYVCGGVEYMDAILYARLHIVKKLLQEREVEFKRKIALKKEAEAEKKMKEQKEKEELAKANNEAQERIKRQNSWPEESHFSDVMETEPVASPVVEESVPPPSLEVPPPVVTIPPPIVTTEAATLLAAGTSLLPADVQSWMDETDVDPGFLEALPPDIREDCIRENMRALQRERSRAAAAAQREQVAATTENNVNQSASTTVTATTTSTAVADILAPPGVCPTWFAELPENLQREIASEYNTTIQANTASSSTAAPVINAADFFSGMSSETRREILTDMDRSQLALMPEEIQNEALQLRRDYEERLTRTLRSQYGDELTAEATPNNRQASRRYARLRQNWQEAVVNPDVSISELHDLTRIIGNMQDVRLHNLSRSNGRMSFGRISRPTSNAQSTAQGYALPIMDERAISCLLGLLCVHSVAGVASSSTHSSSENLIGLIQKLLVNLSYHHGTRQWIMQGLLSILYSIDSAARHRSTRYPDTHQSYQSLFSMRMHRALGISDPIFLLETKDNSNESVVVLNYSICPKVAQDVLSTFQELLATHRTVIRPKKSSLSAIEEKPDKHFKLWSYLRDWIVCDVLWNINDTTAPRPTAIENHPDYFNLLLHLLPLLLKTFSQELGSSFKEGESDRCYAVYGPTLGGIVTLLATSLSTHLSTSLPALANLKKIGNNPSLGNARQSQLGAVAQADPRSSGYRGVLPYLVPNFSVNGVERVNSYLATLNLDHLLLFHERNSTTPQVAADNHENIPNESETATTSVSQEATDIGSGSIQMDSATTIPLSSSAARETTTQPTDTTTATTTSTTATTSATVTTNAKDKKVDLIEATAPSVLQRLINLMQRSHLWLSVDNEFNLMFLILMLARSNESNYHCIVEELSRVVVDLAHKVSQSLGLLLDELKRRQKTREVCDESNLPDLSAFHLHGSSQTIFSDCALLLYLVNPESLCSLADSFTQQEVWSRLSSCIDLLQEEGIDCANIFVPLIGTICLTHSLIVQEDLKKAHESKISAGQERASSTAPSGGGPNHHLSLGMTEGVILTPRQHMELSHLTVELSVPCDSPTSMCFDKLQSSPSVASDSRELLEFLERHGTLVNKIVRRVRGSLSTIPFCVLIHFPRVLDFDVKCAFFRESLGNSRNQMLSGSERLMLSRSRLFEDSYSRLHRKTPQTWKKRFVISFKNEEGQDAGGLLREWYELMSREIFNPNYCLFRVSPGDRVTYTVNPSSYVNNNHLSYFRFVGHFIGKAIYDNKQLSCYFTRSIYKHILGKPVSFADIESEDHEFYKGLGFLLQHPIAEIGYDMRFSTEINEFGETRVVELVPNGRNIPVTDLNKKQYVAKVCQEKMTGSIRLQLASFLQGLYEIIPKSVLSIFNEQELELLICGLPTIDIDDLRQHTNYHGYTRTSSQIVWFWQALESFEDADKACFLQFVTGTSRVPLGGFANLEGMNGPTRFSIHMDSRSPQHLPQAHTCFNQLDLPVYQNYEQLHKQLLTAIRECSEGFGFA